jgi:tripartite-type tricarboxylate transporter receptor subunit TctC
MAIARCLLSLAIATVCAMTICAFPARAQSYPDRPVRIVVPFAPGGLNDTVGRILAASLSERLGKQFVVENRPGAGGIVGSELVANAPKDGYTLLIVSVAQAVNAAVYKLPYDPAKAFSAVSVFIQSPNALGVTPGLPAQTLREFVALAKAKPGELRYGSGGVGGSLHLGFELFKLAAGVDIVHVPFRGAGPAIIDIAGGHTHAIVTTVTSLAPHVRSGKLRALGVGAPKRSPVLPEVPTFDEGGVHGYDAPNWVGIVAPAGTPEAIVALLNREIAAIQDLPEIRKRLEGDGAEMVKMTVPQANAFMVAEIGKWSAVVKRAGIKAE